jgi:transmembrane protein EpsG
MVFINSISFFLLNFVDYQEYEQFEGNAGAYTFTAIFLFIAIIALFKRKMILKQNPLSDNYFNAFAIAILLLPMAWIHPALLRITMYFSIFIILLIPEIIQNFQQYSFKLRRGLTVISVGILFVLFIKNNYSNDKSEYRFFWEEVKLGKNYE